ncbi:hypothetical protein B9T31_08295 [Acinetobacter sp. ANC 4558]|uniref:hypothetical protein n=1 Tax=Acinetobacter sp. ANC 4558 TaxID=1977876 RepID=UPI000A343F0A|nr:hypothetical protein [Acinetobacter sp. ANC 4558]OTG86478.1 hypothetical protein B9T31_08295 [Acinetobacter sp. ANC 4558]
MKSKILLSAIIAFASFTSVTSFAATDDQAKKLDAAFQSTNIKQGLVNVCVDDYTKAGALNKLTKAEVTKLCSCNVDSRGRMTESQKWELQSATNAKNQNKVNEILTRLQKSEEPKIKACLGADLQKKLLSLQAK